MVTSIWRAVVVRGDPVEEERGAVRVLRLGCDAIGQRGRHGRRRSAGRRGRHQEEPDVAGQVLVVVGVLPVAIEREDALALHEAGVGVGILDGVDVGREVATLDPLLEVLGGGEVRGCVDRRARLLEDPVVDGACRADGRHERLQREGEPHAALGAAPLHDREEPGGLGLGEQSIEIGERRWRLGHTDLGGQLLVVEDAGQAVVETHAIEDPVPRVPSVATRFWSSCGTGHLSQPNAFA